MKKGPFIHKFQTTNHRYVYDMNTNAVVRVDKLTCDLIEEYGVISDEELINKYSASYEPSGIKDAVLEIRRQQATSGLFSSHRPKNIWFVESDEELEGILNSRLNMLEFNVTEQCNMRCRYCTFSGSYPKERRHSSKKMTWEIAKQAIDFFFARNGKNTVVYLCFYGGEPLLAFDLIKKIVDYVHNTYGTRRVIYYLDSNGLIMNQDIADFLRNNKILFFVSLDGCQELHDRYRITVEGKESFQLIIKNLGFLKNVDEQYYSMCVEFLVTVTPPYYLEEIEKFFSSSELTEKNRITLNYINTRDTTFFNGITNNSEHLVQEKTKILERYINALLEGHAEREVFLNSVCSALFRPVVNRKQQLLSDSISPNHACIPGSVRLFVNTEGQLYPCEQIGEHFCIGNVITGFDRDAIKQLMNRFLKLVKDECIECWAIRMCNVCYPHARDGDTLDGNRMKEACLRMRNDLHDALVLFATIKEKNKDAFDFMRTDHRTREKYV